MTNRAVHWHEGMFLRPQHFMAADRSFHEAIWQGDRWLQHYGWGLRAIDFDRDALSHGRLVIGSLQARLRDGTQVSIPEDGAIADFDLRPAFDANPEVTVFLGCPILSPWRPNIAEAGSAEPTRYLRDVQQVEDLNTGGNPRPIDLRRLNLKILAADREPEGYDLIPLARLRKSSGAEALPQLDQSYIPPVIACDAWAPLQSGILRSVLYRLGLKLELLGSQAETRGITFDTNYQGDGAVLSQIAALNEAVATLGVVAHAEGIHPLAAYLELCKVVGRLAIFGPSRRVAELPRYDHQDLGGCFFGVKRQLDALLDLVVEPSYRERPFTGAGMRMQVDLEPAWVEPKWQVFVGVKSPLAAEECVALLTQSGRLGMKLGSSDQVDSIYRLGRAGLHFRHAPYPPRVMPASPDTVFFQVDRERSPADWSAVQRSLTLAIRLNEKMIMGDIQGRRELSIKADPLATTMQFTLYLAPAREGAS